MRLARVSCGATLPIPGSAAYKTVTSYQVRRGGRGEAEEVAITTRSRLALVSRALFLVLTLISLLPSLLSVHALSLSPSNGYIYYGANCGWDAMCAIVGENDSSLRGAAERTRIKHMRFM